MIAWWAKSRNLAVAGVRIRVHHVMRELRRQGCEVGWYQPDRREGVGTLVLHKVYDDATREHAAALQRSGVRIVFDLCDNHFYNPQGLPKKTRRAEALRRMAALADVVVVSTPTLGEVVSRGCELAAAPVVIPDTVDDLSSIPVTWRDRLRADFPTALLRRRVRASVAQGRTPLLWFGHHGQYLDVGMLDLLRLRESLEALDRRLPLHLSVVSNDRDKFRANFGHWSFPVVYAEWSAHRFADVAAEHRIALIPVIENDFTRVKSENRVVTAFTHGLAVIADPLPSYRRFADCLVFSDWSAGIERYAREEDRRRRDVEAGRRLSLDYCGIDAVARQWRDVLNI